MKNFTWYVAGPWDHRPAVREIIEKINKAGWKTNSNWAAPENPDVDPADPKRDALLKEQAIRDVKDVFEADGLIYVNSKKSDGKATELGLALATLKPVLILGDREGNIFLNLEIPAFPTVEEMLTWLEGDGQFYINFVQAKQMEYIQHTTDIFDGDDISQMGFPSE